MAGLNGVPARSTPVHGPRGRTAGEIDFERLRSGRLARLQASLRAHGIAVALLSNPASIRYATGTDVMHVWTAENFARYTVVPAAGMPILFEYPKSIHVSERFIDDVRPAFSFGTNSPEARTKEWARGLASLLRELGLDGEPVAIDRLDTPQFLSLLEEGITVIDAGPPVNDAREVKTPEEIELMTINGEIGDEILAEFEAAIRPGLHEYELLAVLGNALLRRHGEILLTRLTASGTNTNPWMNEAHDKTVRPGDVVAIDTDANGYQGYIIDVSRTFLCGDIATPAQKDAYQAAHEHLIGMVDLVKPGMGYGDFARLAPKLPAKYKEQRYQVMMHQAGLEIGHEGPGIPGSLAEGIPYVWQDREFRQNMVCCFESYCGEVGGSFGIKLEDQVVIGPNGAELISTYPFDPTFF
jgi:Xaa-Pro aminopeptidase